MLKRGEELQCTKRQQCQQRHQRKTRIEAPECRLEKALMPGKLRLHASEAEEHKADAEHAIHTKKRGVAMQRREVQSLHVIKRERRVDEEAEETGPHKGPERDCDGEHDRRAE